MRTNSHLAVGSPTVRVAVVMTVTLLLAVALAAVGAGVSRLFAADGPIIVAQDGSGHFKTISEAVEAVDDGGTIEVRTGTYVEAVEIAGKDLTIKGDGEPDEIVLELDPSAPAADIDWSGFLDSGDDPYPVALLITGSKTAFSGLTVVAPHEEEAILVLGPDTVADFSAITVRSLGEVPGGINAVYWENGAAGSLRNSHIEGWVGMNDGAQVVVEKNMMPAACVGLWGEGADVVIRDNVIHGCEYEKGLEIFGDNIALIEDNEIWVEDLDPGPPVEGWGGREAIQIDGTGVGPITIRNNSLRDSKAGVVIDGESQVTFEQNTVSGNETGVIVQVATSNEAVLSDNLVSGNETGVVIDQHLGTFDLSDNRIESNGLGLVLSGATETTIQGNRICDNEVNVQLNVGAEAPDGEHNEICPDEPVE